VVAELDDSSLKFFFSVSLYYSTQFMEDDSPLPDTSDIVARVAPTSHARISHVQTLSVCLGLPCFCGARFLCCVLVFHPVVPRTASSDCTQRQLEGSSIRENAQTVLEHYGVPASSLKDAKEHFSSLETEPRIDAALVTTGWMNPILGKLLQRDDLNLELVSLSDPEGFALRHPWFTATTIPKGMYPGKSPVPLDDIHTVAVTALLTSRSDASEKLVHESLAALYQTDLRSSFPALVTAKAAKDYDATIMYPSVVRYHDPSAAFKRLSQTMELASKSKEAVFGLELHVGMRQNLNNNTWRTARRQSNATNLSFWKSHGLEFILRVLRLKTHYYMDKITLFASPRAGEAGERSEPGEGFLC